MERETKQWRARCDFTYPAGKDNYARAKAGNLAAVTRWVEVEKGDVLDDPGPDLLRSWQANDFVEEVK
jgi:hypothetical protein